MPLVRVALISTIAFAIACSDSTAPVPPVASVSVTPDTASVEVRDTVRFAAALKDSSGQLIARASASWSVSDTTRATVTPEGKVVGLQPGAVWVRARADAQTDSARVWVLVPVARIVLTPATVALVKGGTVQLTALPLDSSGNFMGRSVTWTSSSPAKTAVDPFCDPGYGPCAFITALDSGSVTITASAGHQQATAQLTQKIVSFVSLAVGKDHTCGLARDGAVWCWGDNRYGLLAVPYHYLPRTTPGLVRGGLHFTQLSAGGSYDGPTTCGVATDGLVHCWGYGGHGELGRLPGSDTMPDPVDGNLTYLAVSEGVVHGCALVYGGYPYCWGSNSGHQLGIDNEGTWANHAYPTAVDAAPFFASIHAGDAHTCGLTAAGTAHCWGSNAFGQLGNDSFPPASWWGPRLVRGGLTFASITAGAGHSCGLTAGGQAYCWGRNDFGQLGDGDTLEVHTPTAVTGGLAFRALAAGSINTCGITLDGTAYCWGGNLSGELGVGSVASGPQTMPQTVSGGLRFTSIETSGLETCGIATDGLAYCWGMNTYGQLGNGGYTNASVPTLVVGQR